MHIPTVWGPSLSSPPINIKFLFSFLLLKIHTSLHYTLWRPCLCHCKNVSPSPKLGTPLAFRGLRPHSPPGYSPPPVQISTHLDTLLEKPDSKIKILCQKQQDQTKQNKTKSRDKIRGGVEILMGYLKQILSSPFLRNSRQMFFILTKHFQSKKKKPLTT